MARRHYLLLLFILIFTVPAFAGTDQELAPLQREITAKQSQLAKVQSEIGQRAAEQPRPADRLNQLQQQQEQLNREIIGLKADLLDLSLKEPVWAEGAGAAVLDPGATMKDCQQAALDRALQDAEANAGSLLMAAIAQVEPDPAVRDRIKASLRFKLLEQDGSGDFGKALPAVQGETVKYAARVRAKIQCDQYSNPYRPVSEPPQPVATLPPAQTQEESKGDYKTFKFGDSPKQVDEKAKQLAKAGEVKRGWLTGIVSVNFLNRAADLEFWYYKDRLYRIDIEFQTRFQEYEDDVAMQNFLNQELIPLFDEMYGPTPKKYAIPAKENIYEDWISDLAVWELPRKTITVGINADIYKSYDKKDTNKVISVTYYYELTVIIKDNELAAEKEKAEEAAKSQSRQQVMNDF